MALLRLLLLLLPVTTAALSEEQAEDTQSAEPDQRHHDAHYGLGTKRPYVPLSKVMRGGSNVRIKHPLPPDFIDPLLSPPVCGSAPAASSSSSHVDVDDDQPHGPTQQEAVPRLAYVAMVARHGARYPTLSKLRLARAAATFVCTLGHLDAQHQTRRWCERLLLDLNDVIGGAIAPLGVVEQETLGKHVAEVYMTLMEADDFKITALTSAQIRTQESCQAFTRGAGNVYPAADKINCSEVSDAIIRPYLSCARVRQHRLSVLKSNIPESVSGSIRASAAELLGITLVVAAATTAAADGLHHLSPQMADDVALGLYYACQTDITLMSTAAALREGDVVSSSVACATAGRESLRMMEHAEDVENYNSRGFQLRHSREVMSPLLRRITKSMEEALISEAPPHLDLYFAHDSSVLPMVALMELLDLGTQAAGSGAASICPYSSRLFVEVWDSGGTSLIIVRYNDMVVRAFEGGLAQWKDVYREQLNVSDEDTCALEKAAQVMAAADEHMKEVS